MNNWFQAVGNHPDSSISNWHEWPGPEEPTCEAVRTIAQEHYDKLEQDFGVTYEEFHEKVNEVLLEIAKVHQWDKEEDCYDPRSAAAWEAAWVGSSQILL